MEKEKEHKSKIYINIDDVKDILDEKDVNSTGVYILDIREGLIQKKLVSPDLQLVDLREFLVAACKKDTLEVVANDDIPQICCHPPEGIEIKKQEKRKRRRRTTSVNVILVKKRKRSTSASVARTKSRRSKRDVVKTNSNINITVGRKTQNYRTNQLIDISKEHFSRRSF
ncbi:uncharacterized protein LOC129926988 isoform X2 [Biomphalaria glabrata]|uniref:Uncharacterized protein LOC129926988 isoform X2 n=1 Tax=Biomphalaria glabrata TaxID=6526 RepID=A0A9W3ARX0_BIOGL|nr:uncharacterized protein LOC129926988 isoform X2 [Biomphalaria glabrata]